MLSFSNFLTRLLMAVLAIGAATVEAKAAPGPKVVSHADAAAPALVARQSSSRCLEYSRVANISTVGANLTYSAPFLAASPDGTRGNLVMFAEAAERLPALMMDPDLNEECGNMSEIAFEEAENNFTSGIILQFDELPEPDLRTTVEVIGSVFACIIFICIPALFMTE